MNEKMKVKLRLVTPALAENYLKFNTINRKVSEKNVLFLSNQMKYGLFYENGESIVFDWFGKLTQGQHRLLAIIKSGMSYTIPIVTGVAPDVMSTYDTGKNRTAADVLGMNGFKYGNVIASFIKAIDKYSVKKSKSGGLFSTNRTLTLTNNEVLNICKDEYEWILPLVSTAFSYNSKQTPIVLTTTQIALIAYIYWPL